MLATPPPHSYSYSLAQDKEESDILNNNTSIISKLLKIWLQGQIIMHRLDIRRQHLTALDGSRTREFLSTAGATHPAVRAVAFRSKRKDGIAGEAIRGRVGSS